MTINFFRDHKPLVENALQTMKIRETIITSLASLTSFLFCSSALMERVSVCDIQTVWNISIMWTCDPTLWRNWERVMWRPTQMEKYCTSRPALVLTKHRKHRSAMIFEDSLFLSIWSCGEGRGASVLRILYSIWHIRTYKIIILIRV